MRVLKYLSFVFMVVAVVGFYQSSLLHLNTILYPAQAVSKNWWLSWGLFIVWIPAVFASRKLEENSSEQDSWKIIFKSRWVEFIILGLFAYGFIHYFFCWFTLLFGKGDSVFFDYWRIRGNSGATIPWYATAAVILYSFWRS
ncbi:MAG: hypothetical protein KI793_34090 [Rivularia sp. (in: Bacteria)]|nr:hypothetical protein [Rivularia sp. MS3]